MWCPFHASPAWVEQRTGHADRQPMQLHAFGVLQEDYGRGVAQSDEASSNARLWHVAYVVVEAHCPSTKT